MSNTQALKQTLTHQKYFLPALLGTILCLGVALYWSGLLNVMERWQEQAEYSHGFLIPFISLYLLWERQQALHLNLNRFSWWALVPFTLALLMLVVGELSALYLLVHYSFLVFLFAVALLFLGKQTRLVLVPIGLLAFAIPIPYFIEVILTAKMQLLSSSLGVGFIKLLGIPVLLNGNIIDFGHFQLHVVEACSGMRYLFPFACIGFITAYLYRAVLWKKALVFLTTFPITLLMNSFRIAATGVLVDNFGSEVADGFVHDFEGWVVFVLCLLILIIEIYLLEKFTSKLSLAQAFKPKHFNESTQISVVTSPGIAAFACCIVLILSAKAVTVSQTVEQEFDQDAHLAGFPMSLDQWQGTRVALPAEVIAALQFDEYVNVDYFSSTDLSNKINFYVAYYKNQRKGVSPHSPRVCIPGGGWEISDFRRTKIHLANQDASLNNVSPDGSVNMPVNRVVISKGSNRQLVYYWFVERGQVVANEYVKKWWLFRDAISQQRSDGALVRVVMPVYNSDIQQADAAIQDFIRTAQPRLLRFLPN